MGIMAFQLQPDPAMNSGHFQIERYKGSPAGKDLLRCRRVQNRHDTPSIAWSGIESLCSATLIASTDDRQLPRDEAGTVQHPHGAYQ
jgi:hypothetical protein